VEVGEQFADGRASEKECQAAFRDADGILGLFLAVANALDEAHVTAELEPYRSVISAAGISPDTAINGADAAVASVRLGGVQRGIKTYYPGAYHTSALALAEVASADSAAAKAVEAAEGAAQCDLLRDILGNPLRPPLTVDPLWLGWNGGTVVELTQGIYDDRAFDCLPILADALEEAGCHDAGILGHCRQPGPHVRGCWVIDALLGKN
jgi:hypothetical protein